MKSCKVQSFTVDKLSRRPKFLRIGLYTLFSLIKINEMQGSTTKRFGVLGSSKFNDYYARFTKLVFLSYERADYLLQCFFN